MHPLTEIIRGFKTFSSRKINDYLKSKKFSIKFQWQRSYHDHIIRNQNSYEKINRYIKYNHLIRH
ncbi:MAG: hypothetical protein GF347_03970 [Candidatus Moranbacteria bacterium]|nr:hypothetical protein [Candidatus Moranbacteria bacterium]